MPCNSSCGESMGLDVLGDQDTILARKFRWKFNIRNSIGGSGEDVLVLPHRKSSRPILGWKEYEFQHLTETIFYPLKPAWEPIELVLYDARRCKEDGVPKCHPVFNWISQSLSGNPGSGMYNPQEGDWRPIVPSNLKRTADLYILGGSGKFNEHWVLENCYPQHVRWGELDMDSSDILTVEVTLRYDRAYCVNLV